MLLSQPTGPFAYAALAFDPLLVAAFEVRNQRIRVESQLAADLPDAGVQRPGGLGDDGGAGAHSVAPSLMRGLSRE